MFNVISNPAGLLLSGQTTSGAGSAMNTRAAGRAFFSYAAASPSAIVKLQASYNLTAWVTVGTFTATPTTATAQISAYYPYVQGVLDSAFGGGGSTGSASMYYSPII